MKHGVILGLTAFMLLNFACKEKKTNDTFADIPLLKKLNKIDLHYGQSPDLMSVNFNNQIKQSISFYDQGDFKNAKAILEDAYINEPENIYIQYNYARASYQIDKETSFRVYNKLIAATDSMYYDPNFQIIIVYRIRDAYWKLGTLYMDNGQWDKAYFEISRFLFSIQDQKKEYVYSQALEYLTECAFNLYDDDLTKYLAKRTLYYDPKNEYVKDLLQKIKK